MVCKCRESGKKIVECMDVRCAWSRTRSKWPKWVNNATPSNRNIYHCCCVLNSDKYTYTHIASRRWKLNQSSHGQKASKNTHVTNGKKGPNKPYHAFCPLAWLVIRAQSIKMLHYGWCAAAPATFWIPNWWTENGCTNIIHTCGCFCWWCCCRLPFNF